MVSAVLCKIFQSLFFLSYFLKLKYYKISFPGLLISCGFIILNCNSFAIAQNNSCDIPPCTIAGNAEYKKNWQFYWLPSNPQAIGRNSEVEVGVFGGYPPFVWIVSGNGFSMAEEETSGRNNVLISSSTACGSASITVTDTNGYMTTGSLRCSAGKWSGLKSGCVFGGVDEYVYEGGATYYPNGPMWKFIIGKYQQLQTIAMTQSGDCGQTCDRCPENCAQKEIESALYQCSPCLNNTSIVPCRSYQNLGKCCTVYQVDYNEWVCN